MRRSSQGYIENRSNVERDGGTWGRGENREMYIGKVGKWNKEKQERQKENAYTKFEKKYSV